MRVADVDADDAVVRSVPWHLAHPPASGSIDFIATAGSVSITPNPVAAEGALHAGQAVKLTVTAFNASGAPDPFAYVRV